MLRLSCGSSFFNILKKLLTSLFLQHHLSISKLSINLLKSGGKSYFWVIDGDILTEIIHDEFAKSCTHVNRFISFALNLINLEDRTHAAIKHELDVCQVEHSYSIEVEEIEQETDFLEEFGFGENGKSREELKSIYKSIIVCIPDNETRFIGSKDLFKLCKINAEVVTY